MKRSYSFYKCLTDGLAAAAGLLFAACPAYPACPAHFAGEPASGGFQLDLVCTGSIGLRESISRTPEEDGKQTPMATVIGREVLKGWVALRSLLTPGAVPGWAGSQAGRGSG